MAAFGNIITKHLRFNKLFFSFSQINHIHDRHLDYFRNKDGYKNSLIQLNGYKESKLVSSGISFQKGKDVQVDDFLSHFLQRENVMKLSTAQLKDTLCMMANSQIDSEKYGDALRYIDEKCAMSVDRWPLDFSLCVLDGWFIVLGTKTFRKHYYCALTNLLSKKMKRCSKYNLMLVLHFIGLSKRSPPFLMELIKYKLENFISDFSDEEWALVCLSFFKTSTKINSNLVLQKCCKAAENLLFKNDRFNLISILKCLRLSEYFDDNLMNMVEEYIKREYTTFNFVECTNFLATFATQNVYNFEIYSCLESHGISQLSKEDSVVEFSKKVETMHPSERSRVKDLARFLWGMAFIGHDIHQKSINCMLDILNARLNIGEFEPNLPALIDCLQSLILFGCYPSNIIEYVLKPDSIEKISYINKAKPKYQLFFIDRSAYIQNCVTEITNKTFLNNIPKSLQKEILERKGFQDLIQYLKVHLKKTSFTYCYIMPHIMISGIVVATNLEKENTDKLITSTLSRLIENGIISKSIQDILHMNKMYTCIEILDPSVCVHGSLKPLGLMKTKIRQLQKLHINVITLSSDEISALTNSSNENMCSKLQNLIM